MSILTVGFGQQYSTIASAVNAAQSGDSVNVTAGTYTNDFVTIRKDLTLNAIGGTVIMAATVQPPDGKAILTEGGSGITVNIDGFAFTGATVPDRNGAGIRYEGGTLHIANAHFFNNENGILGGVDPNGIITIDHSEFDHNGVNGSGYTHNIYIGNIAAFSLTNSFSHDANIGHEVKSRAASNTITGNVILDNQSTSSYEIDLPNGGKALISGNIIQQGLNSENPNVIAYGEEGAVFGGSLVVSGNTIVNDLGRGPALWNATGVVAQFTNNAVYGFGNSALVNGPANANGTVTLGSRPLLIEGMPRAPNTAPVAPPLDPPLDPPQTGPSVFRFFDSRSGTQFLTASQTERDVLLATRPDLTSEGVGFGAVTDPSDAAASVYRFFDTSSGTHFFTSSATERDQVAATRADMTYEGVAFYQYSTPEPGAAAIYRFFDSNAGTHFFTSSPTERAAILSSRPDLITEGVAFYAPTT